MATSQLKYTTKPKKQKNHGDLANALIEIAVEYIAENKTTEFALRDLAHKLGVSHAAAYKHYKNKNALLETIALRGFMIMESYFETSLLKGHDKLLNLSKGYIDFALSNAGYYRVMFSIDYSKDSSSGLQSTCAESFKALIAAFGNNNKKNVCKAFYVWSLIHGFVMLRLDGQINHSLEDHNITYEELENYLLKMVKNLIE